MAKEVKIYVDEAVIPTVYTDLLDCPVVNLTEKELALRQFCQSEQWFNWRDNGTHAPEEYADAGFSDIYILCESIYQPRTALYDMVITFAVLVALVFLMTGLGVTMEPGKIWKHAKRPVGAIVATVVQFGAMPFVAWGIAIALNMNEINMLAIVVLGSCPGGTLSNFMALLLRGDMNLSILMTSVSTVVGIGAIPFMISFISSFFLDPCSTLQSATLKIIVSLLFTLLPCAFGMLLKAKCSQRLCDVVLKLGQLMMVVAMVLLFVMNFLIFGLAAVLMFPIPMLIACALLPFIGFVLGFGCSYAVCEAPRARRTIMLETGLKNAQICLAILKVSFPIERLGVLQMMPLYFLLFQVLESAVLAFIFTKVLTTKDEEEQKKMLAYDDGVEKNPFQRKMSYRIARKTHTRTGKADGRDEELVNSTYRHNLTSADEY